MISAGSTLDFNVRGTTQAAQFQVFYNEAQLAGDVSTKLSALLDVIDVEVKATGTVITGTLPWEYTARVRVRTRVAHASASDVGSMVANAFFRAAGNMPSVSVGASAPPGSSPSPFPRAMQLPDFSWSTSLVVVGLAVIVLVVAVEFG
jgi:hypothetical protein